MSLNLLGINSFFHLNQLDWEILLEKISPYLHFESCLAQLREPIPVLGMTEIEAQYDSLDFFIRHMDEGTFPSLHSPLLDLDPADSFRNLPGMLQKGRTLTIEELHQLAKYIEAFTRMQSPLASWPLRSHYPMDPSSLTTLKNQFVKKLRVFVDHQGQVDYLKHPLLKDLYQELVEIESSVRATLKKIIQSSKYEKVLQFTEYDLIHDHYVLAIRSDSYRGAYGPIIARSETGSTLYVAPLEIREKRNRRLELMAKIDEILNQICLEFSRELFPHYATFNNLRVLFECLDQHMGKARFSRENEFIRPRITEEPQIHMQDLYHPLIKNPVKNDIFLSPAQKGMILSGPNTGGKTATLKTLGLCHLFLHFGLFLPAASADVHPFTGIFFFGHDQQNLAEGLSSFSSEVKEYLSLFPHLTPSNLIIIDEIFNTTSSEEASALALGLFEEIHQFATNKIIVSTHHQMLKIYMHTYKDYLSAHVGFDSQTQTPTYKLIEGTPGSSMALSIFENLTRRFGLGGDVVSKAAQILDQKTVYYESLLQEVSARSLQLSRMVEENRLLQRDLVHQKKTQEGVLKLKLDKRLQEAEGKIQDLLDQSYDLLDSLKKGKMEKAKGFKEFRQIRTDLGEEKEKLQTEFPGGDKGTSKALPPPPTQIPLKIVPGQFYYSTLLKETIQVTSYDAKREEALFKKGNFTMRCPFNSLRELTSPPPPASTKKRPDFQFQVDRASEDYSLEINARGMRLEEFQEAIGRGLDNLLAGRIPHLLVIHGHGEGVLKHWLRTYLKGHPEFHWERESADGATRVYL